MEGGPPGVPDERGDRNANAARARRGPRVTQLEAEPVADVPARGLAQFGLCHFAGRRPVYIYVDGRPHADLPCQQRRGALDDPAAVDEIQALQEPVVSHLPLELLQVPVARERQASQLVREGLPE